MKVGTKSILAALFSAGLVGAAQGAVIAEWGFETNVPPAVSNSATDGPHSPDVGAGQASGVHASTLTDWSNPVGNGSGESYSSNEWAIGDYYQFKVSTVGLADIGFSWHQTRSSTGPATWDLQYATSAGGPFTTAVDDYTVPAISWSSLGPDVTNTTVFSADLSAVTALNNAPEVYFRLVADSAAGGTAGSSRVDNVVVETVPEPSSLALLGLAGLTALRRRK